MRVRTAHVHRPPPCRLEKTPKPSVCRECSCNAVHRQGSTLRAAAARHCARVCSRPRWHPRTRRATCAFRGSASAGPRRGRRDTPNRAGEPYRSRAWEATRLSAPTEPRGAERPSTTVHQVRRAQPFDRPTLAWLLILVTALSRAPNLRDCGQNMKAVERLAAGASGPAHFSRSRAAMPAPSRPIPPTLSTPGRFSTPGW